MSYLKLLNARRTSGDPPRIETIRLSGKQRTLAAEGKCIHCGHPNTDRCSYLCHECQANDTLESIRDDIGVLRRKLLNRPGE